MYLADNDYYWSRLISDQKNLEELKGVLAGKQYIPQKPDYSEGKRLYTLTWVMILQLAAYSIGFGVFKTNDYCQRRYLDKIQIGIGGILTLLLFSPGALPVIIVQFIVASGYRINEHLKARNSQRKNSTMTPALDIVNDSGQVLLEKLQKRIGRN